ncbi:MAG: LptA/OstA family protein [Candidatus Cloacimonadaceae bacterium]|nr:LptA/OstA family protein [Candidatus Cloacimonadaceae bacterium]
MNRISIGSLILLVFFPLFAQRSALVEKFRLIHSDKLFLNRSPAEEILELNGKVHFWYGDMEFKSDRALIFNNQKIARLTGNVSVSNDSLALQADSVAYYRIPEELNIGGKVYITEKKKGGGFRWFRSDYAVYDKKSDKVTVWNNVSSHDEEENAFAQCGYAFWDRKNGYAYMIESPKLRSGKADTLYVQADRMEFFDLERKLVATFNVDVRSSDYNATSDFLIYFLKEDKAVFTGEPVFTSDFAKATAREFYLYFDERKLQRAELVDSCRVFYAEQRGAEKKNWVTAGYVSILFGDDSIREFSAENQVSYYYQQEKKDKTDFFINSATGEFLEAKFSSDNKLDTMRMKKSIKGRYKFHNNS